MRSEIPQKLILFHLDQLPYGLDVTAVQEIMSQVERREVPGAAPHIQGVFDFRGQIIPLVSLRAMLSLPETPAIGNVIVISCQQRLLGLIVDKVFAVLTDQDQITPLPTKKKKADYIQGRVLYKEQEVAVLDLARLTTAVNK